MAAKKKPTAGQVLLILVDTIVEMVQEVSPDPVPEGPLYAHLMPLGINDLEAFQRIIRLVIATGKVKRGPAHCLVAV